MQPVFKGVLYPSIVHSISNLTIVERTRHGLARRWAWVQVE